MPMTVEELIAFEADIASEFNAGHIRAPIHLDSGNETPLIKVFEEIARTDWVCCSWRSHYKALLHGVPAPEVKAAIMAGRSITLCFPAYRFISSAIVGGILPIAVGIAMQIKRAGGSEKVWAFCGDMTALTGIFDECKRYAMGFDLPITFVVEDNLKSVCTPTRDVWGREIDINDEWRFVKEYRYDLPFPHAGAGKRIQF